MRVAVPPSLHKQLGTHRIVSLKTRDAVEARRRRWPVVAAIKAQIEEYRGAKSWDIASLGLTWRKLLSEADDRPDPEQHGYSQRDLLEGDLDADLEHLEEVGREKDAIKLRRMAYHQGPGIALETAFEEWMRDLEGRLAAQTRSQHGYAFRLFREAKKDAVLTSDVDRRMAGDFVMKTLKTSGKAPKTINRIISSLSTLWKWLMRRGIAESNPWEHQGDYNGKKLRDDKKERPYTPEELLKLLQASPEGTIGKAYGSAIGDLIRLGLMTGCRLNELCELEGRDVLIEDKAIYIRSGKTANAIRTIPVSALVWPILERRLKGSTREDKLFPELKPGGPDSKRSWYTSKTFTRFRRKVLGDSDQVDYHSLRRSFATYLAHATTKTHKVNPQVIAELMGHTKGTLALQTYAGKMHLEHLRDALEAMESVIEPKLKEAIVSKELPCSS